MERSTCRPTAAVVPWELTARPIWQIRVTGTILDVCSSSARGELRLYWLQSWSRPTGAMSESARTLYQCRTRDYVSGVFCSKCWLFVCDEGLGATVVPDTGTSPIMCVVRGSNPGAAIVFQRHLFISHYLAVYRSCISRFASDIFSHCPIILRILICIFVSQP